MTVDDRIVSVFCSDNSKGFLEVVPDTNQGVIL